MLLMKKPIGVVESDMFSKHSQRITMLLMKKPLGVVESGMFSMFVNQGLDLKKKVSFIL